MVFVVSVLSELVCRDVCPLQLSVQTKAVALSWEK